MGCFNIPGDESVSSDDSEGSKAVMIVKTVTALMTMKQCMTVKAG